MWANGPQDKLADPPPSQRAGGRLAHRPNRTDLLQHNTPHQVGDWPTTQTRRTLMYSSLQHTQPPVANFDAKSHSRCEQPTIRTRWTSTNSSSTKHVGEEVHQCKTQQQAWWLAHRDGGGGLPKSRYYVRIENAHEIYHPQNDRSQGAQQGLSRLSHGPTTQQPAVGRSLMQLNLLPHVFPWWSRSATGLVPWTNRPPVGHGGLCRRSFFSHAFSMYAGGVHWSLSHLRPLPQRRPNPEGTKIINIPMYPHFTPPSRAMLNIA